jgi:hypothetical protein
VNGAEDVPQAPATVVTAPREQRRGRRRRVLAGRNLRARWCTSRCRRALGNETPLPAEQVHELGLGLDLAETVSVGINEATLQALVMSSALTCSSDSWPPIPAATGACTRRW